MSRRARGDAYLPRIISTVSSSLELDEVLAAIVRLLSDASAVHACFVYLLDDDGERLVLKAASAPYEQLVDGVVLERGEGLAWLALERREPELIRDNALSDPRNKYVPELEEEQFQSLLSVPVLGKDGGPIGAVTVHTQAPREFTESEVEVLVSSASLVGSAIENARLYAEMRRRVHELERLSELAETIARTEALEELLPAAAEGARHVLEAEACHVYLIEPGDEELVLRASSPPGRQARPRLGLAELGPELAPRGRRARVTAPLVADDELVGLLVAEGTRRVEPARGLASQIAVGVKKVRLIERLTERNLIKDFLDDLATGRHAADLGTRAERLGCDLGHPHVVLAARPAEEALERALAGALPGSVFDRRADGAIALLRVPSGRTDSVAEIVRGVHERAGSRAAVGLSAPCQALDAYPGAFDEARNALVGTSVLPLAAPVLSYEELGPYKYLLRIAVDGGIRDDTVDAVARLAEYDGQRQTQLLQTLEEFLRRRGNISATADALYVHPNTLRQRLRRIAELTDLDLRNDDWLTIEIAVKMVKLRAAFGASSLDTPAP